MRQRRSAVPRGAGRRPSAGNARPQEEPFAGSAERNPHVTMLPRRTAQRAEAVIGAAACVCSQAARDQGSGGVCSPMQPQGVSPGQTGPWVLSSPFGDVFKPWGKASGVHSTQLASTVNSILVFPCTVHILFINWERKSHLSLPQSNLTSKL